MKISQFRKAVIFLFITLQGTCYSQALKCFLSHIEGMEHEHDLGVHYNGENTRNLSEVKVYMVASDDKLYLQSNYLIEDAKYPVKMLANENNLSAEDFLGNLLFTDEQLKNVAGNLEAFLNTVHDLDLTLDPSVLKSEKFSYLDFSEFRNIRFSCPDNVARSAARLKNYDGTFEYLISFNQSICLRIKRNNLLFNFSKLQNASSFDNIRIISLVENSSTKNLLQQKFANQTLTFDYSGMQSFKSLLLSTKNEKVVLLGHIENNSFITYNPSGEEIFKISISFAMTSVRNNSCHNLASN